MLEYVYRGRYMSRGEPKACQGPLGLTKSRKLGSYHSGPGGYYGRTLVMVVTAVLKAVSLPRLPSSLQHHHTLVWGSSKVVF